MVVRSVLTYGCAVWREATALDIYCKELEILQRCVVIGLTGTIRTVRQALLDIILHLFTLREFIVGEMATFIFRFYEFTFIIPIPIGHTRLPVQGLRDTIVLYGKENRISDLAEARNRL